MRIPDSKVQIAEITSLQEIPRWCFEQVDIKSVVLLPWGKGASHGVLFMVSQP